MGIGIEELLLTKDIYIYKMNVPIFRVFSYIKNRLI